MVQQVSDEKRVKVQALWALLSERHPRAFPPGRSPLVPLKIGIHRDIMDRYPDVDRATVKSFFAFHAYSKPYLEASSIGGSVRLDLDGNEAGVVTEEHAQAARETLAKFAKRKKRAVR